LLDGLSKLQMYIDQITTVSRIATRADFNLKVEKIRKDLGRFIFEYLSSDMVLKGRLNFKFTFQAHPFVVWFRPLEITILFDNLISNAIKAHARCIHFGIATDSNKLVIETANDGEAVPAGLVGSMFDLGISGRGGSGIGLYTCQDIVTGMGGSIKFKGNDKQLGGAAFEIAFFT